MKETVVPQEDDEAEEDPDQVTMEEMEMLIKATKKEAMEIFEEMMLLMEVLGSFFGLIINITQL